MKTKLIFGASLVAMLTFGQAKAQCSDWNWPTEEPALSTAKEKFVLYTDSYDRADFKKATGPLGYLLRNTPDLNTKIYIDGIKIYENLADKEKDAIKKKVYADSAIVLYDLRMKYCNDEANVMNRKVYSYFRYNINDPKEYETLLKMYDKAFEMNGNEVMDVNLVAYMTVIKANKLGTKILNDEQVLERYDVISDIIAYKMKTKPNDKLPVYQETIDGILADIVTIDCDFVKSKLGPKFKETPNDIKLAKKIFVFMLNGKCTDEPLWLEAGKKILQSEPDYGLAKNLGLKALANDDYDAADSYFDKAISLTEDPGQKADIFLLKGSLETKRGRKPNARDMYRRALSLDPSKKEAYTSIGLLYSSSFDQCKGLRDEVVDRAVYLVAYDMFEKAGNTKMMQMTKEQFPSKGEIFTRDYKVGDEIKVNCWIGESTTIRSRD
jgi:tetratricopeptide (TPR) repeat protein